MIFRKATIDDINELSILRKQQLIDEGGNPEENNIDTELKQYFMENIGNNKFIAWLAIENNKIIGTSGLCFYKLPPNFSNPSGNTAYITNMFTVKEYRRKGIAKILLEKIVNEARLLNYKILRLHSSDMGKTLYLKYGFIESEGYMHLRI